jgi:hypothetical protein
MSVREEFGNHRKINPYTGRKFRAKKAKYPRKATFEEINMQPPEFMPPVPADLKGEGYWSDTYLPIISQQEWPWKYHWIDKVKFIESGAQRFQNDIKESDYFGSEFSRLVPDFEVGCTEYKDGDVFWPGGYVEHYIGDHNVMPTERFYNYINEKYDSLRHKLPFDHRQFALK